MPKRMSITGRWRITEMNNWDPEAINLVQPGFIEFGEDGLGRLGFIAVTGELDWRNTNHDGRPGVGFSRQGSDEGDEASGRGWAALSADGILAGYVYFHLGDDFAFRGERFSPTEPHGQKQTQLTGAPPAPIRPPTVPRRSNWPPRPGPRSSCSRTSPPAP